MCVAYTPMAHTQHIVQRLTLCISSSSLKLQCLFECRMYAMLLFRTAAYQVRKYQIVFMCIVNMMLAKTSSKGVPVANVCTYCTPPSRSQMLSKKSSLK
jgi:hypothetical protein